MLVSSPRKGHAIVAAAVGTLVAAAACMARIARADHAPATAPHVTGAGKSAVPGKAIDPAIDALRKEYAAWQKDPKSPPRDACNYFAQNPNPDVKPDALLAALEKPIPGDPRAASYIRWQLLSGLPDPIDPHDVHLLDRAIQVYRKAPLPAPRYGLSAADQGQLDAMLAAARRQDDVVLNSKLEQAVQKVAEANLYIIAYRDEFYRRLPKVPPVFIAAIQDADERLKAAAGVRDWFPTVAGDIYGWLGSDDMDPKQAGKLADAIGELRLRAAPQYYDHAALEGKKFKLAWVKKNDSPNPGDKLPRLQQDLLEASQKPKPAAKPGTRPAGAPAPAGVPAGGAGSKPRDPEPKRPA